MSILKLKNWDRFNAAVANLKQVDDGLNQIIETHIKWPKPGSEESEYYCSNLGYFIVNDRFDDLSELFEVFDTDSSFQVITAQADNNNNRPIKTWYIGNLVDDFGERNTSILSVTKVASYRTKKGGITNSGSMTFCWHSISTAKPYLLPRYRAV